MTRRVSTLTAWLYAFTSLLANPAIANEAAAPTTITADSCGKKSFPHPLKNAPTPFSSFNTKRRHMGTDYSSKEEDVMAVAKGKITKIGWDSRTLEKPNERSHLSIQGWGRYVIVHHDDGTESLYAHLVQDSTKLLKVGQSVQPGDVLGQSDTTGGATGAHLHFEYTLSGDIFDRDSKKIDPHTCILRNGTFSMTTAWHDAEAVFQIFISDQLVGENSPGKAAKFHVALKPGKYPIRVTAKQIKKYREATYSIEMSTGLTILNEQGAELGPGLGGPLEVGKSDTSILYVE